jgi:type IV pilus assembly protein PilY1
MMNRYQRIKSLAAGTLFGMGLAVTGLSHAAPLNLGSVPLFLANQADPNVFFEIDDSGSMDFEITINEQRRPAGTSTIQGVLGSTSGNAASYMYNNAENLYNPGFYGVVSVDWRARCNCLNVMAYNPANTYLPWPGMTNAVFTLARSNPQPGATGYGNQRDLTGDFYYTWTDTNLDGLVDPGEQGAQVIMSAASADATNYANWYQYHRRRSFAAKAAVGAVVEQNTGFRYGLSLINDWSGTGNKVFVEVPSAATTNYLAHNNNLLQEFYDYNWEPQGTPLPVALKRTGDYFNSINGGNNLGKTDPIISECQKNFTVLFTDGFWSGNPSVGDDDGDGHSNTVADVARQYYDTDLSALDNSVPPDTFDTNTRQHMVTFTVAFGVNGALVDTDSDGWPNPALTESGNWGNPLVANSPAKVDDLWHAAYNSKGTFVAAQSPQDVASGLNAALQNIQNRTSSAASVALNAGSIGANSRVYQARFDASDWSGQLLSYSIGLNGIINATPNWDAGCKITGGTCPTTGGTETGQNWDTGREIITYKPSNSTGIPFRWPTLPATPTASELDVAQTALLNTDPDTSVADLLGSSRLDYTRGRTVAAFRPRANVLGPVIHASPVFIGAPAFNYPDNLEASPYSTFRNSLQNRPPIIWFGADDGMFHGVDAGLTSPTQGEEKLAYIPSSVYQNLNQLGSLNYTHKYFVDGSPTAGDVYFGGAWKTVIVSGLAGGGQGLFALDVTTPANFDESNASTLALWEFTDRDDADLGFSYGQPSIVKMQNGAWVAIFGNGYNNTIDNDGDGVTNDSATGNAVIYIVDIATGTLLKKFDTLKGTADDPLGSSRPNGMASPTVIDVDGDHLVDYIFAGDLFGNLWKIDVRGNTVASWVFANSGGTPVPLFTTDDGTGMPQPITSSPEVSLAKETPTGPAPDMGESFLVYFGTGKYFEAGDNSAVGQQTQTFYSVWDKNTAAFTAPTRAQMLQQTITLEISEDFDTDGDGTDDFSRDVRETSNNAINWHLNPSSVAPSGSHVGWYLDLINPNTSANEGERQVTDSALLEGIIIFTTLVPSADPCDFGGDSWIMALNFESGGRLDTSAFDFNQDGTYDEADTIAAAGASGNVASGAKSRVGILPRLTFAKGYSGGGGSGGGGGGGGGGCGANSFVGIGSGSTGGFETQCIKRPGSAYGRQTWHQLR